MPPPTRRNSQNSVSADSNHADKDVSASTKTKSVKTTSDACGECKKNVKDTDKAMCCEICEEWYHINCANISQVKYDLMTSSNSHDTCDLHWYCKGCNRGATKILNSLVKLEARLFVIENKVDCIDKKCAAIENNRFSFNLDPHSSFNPCNFVSFCCNTDYHVLPKVNVGVLFKS